MVMQRKPLLIVVLSLAGLSAPFISKSQVVYSTDYKGDADLVVYKTKYKGDAEGNKGIWYFTEYSGDAKKSIYFTDYKGDADLVIYFTEYKGEAGWNNKRKQELMY